MSKGPAAGQRLRRLLAVLPWIAERGGATLGEIGDRFGLAPGKVERELELASMCGMPPYTPDVLFSIMLTDDWVSVDAHDLLSRPLRLSAAEGFRVLAAGSALLDVPGVAADGSLGQALAKLRGILGDAVTVDLEDPPLLEALAGAAADGRTVAIEYYAVSTDEVSRRVIDPLLVHAHEGLWYVEAFDHGRGERRRFRVSRVQAVEPTGERFTPNPASVDVSSVFTPGADTTVVTLRLPPSARWVIETYPTVAVDERPDGSLDVALAVAGRPWLERLLLRVGPEATVLDPPDLAGVGAAAAARVLARYA